MLPISCKNYIHYSNNAQMYAHFIHVNNDIVSLDTVFLLNC